MTEILVVRLSNHAAAEWLTVDATGARINNVAIGSLEQAATEAIGRKVVVLVPGTDVLLSEPELPPKSAAKLAQIVPFALEEQLASDVETLHFAIGKRDERPGTPVAIVARKRMDEWLEALNSAGLVPSAMYADTQAVPVTPNGVTLLLDGTAVYVQRPQIPGTVLEIEPLLEALQFALEGGTESREHATFYLTEEHYERERDLLDGMREFTASLQLKLLPDGALPVMAATIAQQPGLNLLQGPYTVKSNIHVSLAPWRYAAILAGAFVVVHLGLKIAELRSLQQAETRLNGEIDGRRR
jgi:general secretion pathway protein L